MMSVGELHLKYRAPARYDELVEVCTRLKDVNRRKVVFVYEITRQGARLVEGESVHVVTGPDGRARTMPEPLLAFIRRALPDEGA